MKFGLEGSPPTPYPDVNLVLDKLLDGARTVLGERFVGLYLYGSLSSGDFNPHTSDVDFLIVTDGEVPDELVPDLKQMHMSLLSSGLKWAAKLEGSYIPLTALPRYVPNDLERPHLNEGKFYMAQHGSDWVIQRHILRQGGLVVAGPPIREMIDPVSPEDIRRAVQNVVREWWAPMLDAPSFLERADYQAYAVLTMCRVLYTMAHGDIASKPVSARWAQVEFVEQAQLIQQALDWDHSKDFSRFDEVFDFLRFAVGRCLGD